MSKFDEAFKPTPIENAVEHARASVHINGADLKAELERNPSDLAHYGFEFARAHRRYLAAKMTFEETQAQLMLKALGEKWPADKFREALDKQAWRRLA